MSSQQTIENSKSVLCVKALDEWCRRREVFRAYTPNIRISPDKRLCNMRIKILKWRFYKFETEEGWILLVILSCNSLISTKLAISLTWVMLREIIIKCESLLLLEIMLRGDKMWMDGGRVVELIVECFYGSELLGWKVARTIFYLIQFCEEQTLHNLKSHSTIFPLIALGLSF